MELEDDENATVGSGNRRRGHERCIRRGERGQGRKHMVVIQPASTDVSRNLELNYEYLNQFSGYDPGRLTDTLETICISQGLDCVNLASAFLQNDPDHLYFKGKNDHWNDAGQDLAARRVADHLMQHALAQ